METLKLLLSKAHAEFRRLRSGELGDNLRSQGIDYKIIWGLESYRLKEIACNIQTEIENISSTPEMVIETHFSLAKALWKEDIRESKMLATRLLPIEKATHELAEEWSSEVSYTELADQLCMNLLSRVSFAESLVSEWLNSPSRSNIQKYIALQIALRRDIKVPAAEQYLKDESNPIWIRSTASKLINLL